MLDIFSSFSIISSICPAYFLCKSLRTTFLNNIYILHSHEYENETTIKYNNISVSGDYNLLFEIADNKGPKKNLVIVGISSWSEGQLEGEMERESWALSEINSNLIFEMDNAKKWLNAIKNSFIYL